MMVRFSCFSTPGDYQSPKKVQQLDGKMHSTSQQKSEYLGRKVKIGPVSAHPKGADNNIANRISEQTASPSSHEDCLKSECSLGDFGTHDSKESLQMTRIKKSQSLGSILDKERGSSRGGVTDDDEVDPEFSFKYPHDLLPGSPSSHLHNHETLRVNYKNQQEEDNSIECAHHDSLFSIDVLQQFDHNQHIDSDEQSTDLLADSGCPSPDNHPELSSSRSVTALRGDTDKPTEETGNHKIRHRSRSSGNLHFLSGETTEFCYGDEVLAHQVSYAAVISDSCNLPHESDEDRKGSSGPTDFGEEHHLSDTSGGLMEGIEAHESNWVESFDCDYSRYRSSDNITSSNEKRETETGDQKLKNIQVESPIKGFDKMNPKELHIRRIEEWISQIDIDGGIVEEPGETSSSLPSESQAEVSIPPLKVDSKSNIGMEVAYNYISSLSSTSSAAQMVNLGLLSVPSLNAFSNLRALNLSGNSIVRITPGSLPRGLHMLNLSKNNIAVIEGLRDLTRLRVLDLRYNRIVRIGHGLASCSSLKELYLAGNKIGEVEGLHRLLKLNILDLRANKISTARGLGQLAANFGSLQVINLDGNPAQRNVGDEHLKKYLLSVLPNLVYYNKHSIKSGSTKEISDRTSRSSSRSELKISRRGSHGSSLHRSALSQVRPSHTAAVSMMKPASSRNVVEGRHGRLPPVVSKPTVHLSGNEKKLISLQPSNPIRRSRSEGTL